MARPYGQGKGIAMGKNLGSKRPRDFQVLKVQSAEELASKRIFKTIWTPTLDEDKVIDLVNFTIYHSEVVERLGKVKRDIGVIFGDKNPKGKTSVMASFDVTEMDLYFSPKACTPMSVLHEVSHIYSTKPTLAHHSPVFCAVFHHLLTTVYGKKAGEVLMNAYNIYGVKTDFDEIDVKARRSAQVTWR